MEHEHQHERYEQPPLCHDFVSMTPEAIALRDLIDHLGETAVEQIVIDDAA